MQLVFVTQVEVDAHIWIMGVNETETIALTNADAHAEANTYSDKKLAGEPWKHTMYGERSCMVRCFNEGQYVRIVKWELGK